MIAAPEIGYLGVVSETAKGYLAPEFLSHEAAKYKESEGNITFFHACIHPPFMKVSTPVDVPQNKVPMTNKTQRGAHVKSNATYIF